MWVGVRSAWHSKSLERRSSTYVSGRTGCYFTRCALIRTDDRLLHMQFSNVYLNRDAAAKKMKRANEERCRIKRAKKETD